MRLPQIEHGHSLPHAMRLRLMSFLLRMRAPDVVRTLLHRPELLGGRLNDLTHRVLRGPSPLTVGERELLAAFISRQNLCPF